MKILKVGKASFNKEAVASMTFKDFELLYGSKLKDAKQVYLDCGGKIATRKKKETDD